MKKVFILGAGASQDFGFPSGMELMQEIHSLWNNPGEDEIADYAGESTMPSQLQGRLAQKTGEKITKLSHRLYYSGADSIDDFLSQCSDKTDVQYGRLTILKKIFAREKAALRIADGLFKWKENWLRVLFCEEFRFEKVEQLKKKLETEQFYFMIFNYDRCMEHFLYTAIQNYYGLGDEETKSIIDKVKFYHVYGQLAPLGWQSKENSIGFGAEPDPIFHDWNRFIPNIRIVNEDRNDAATIRDKIGAQVRDANKVYILGFGFQDSNWKLLGIDDYKTHRAKSLTWPLDKFHYTNFGLSKRQRQHIHNKLFGLASQGRSSANFYESKIFEFMHHDYT